MDKKSKPKEEKEITQICQSALLTRPGWTKTFLDKGYIQVADTRYNPVYKCASPMKLYNISDVELVEKSSAFLDWIPKWKNRCKDEKKLKELESPKSVLQTVEDYREEQEHIKSELIAQAIEEEQLEEEIFGESRHRKHKRFLAEEENEEIEIYTGYRKHRILDIKFDFNLLPPDAQYVVDVCKRFDLDFIIVGGFVRDWLSGRKSNDVDIMIPGYLYDLQDIFKGDVIVCRHPIIKLNGVDISPVFTLKNWEKNRDITVNCLGIDSEGYLLDPLNVYSDVRNHIVRMCSRKKIEEDLILCFRICRMAAKLNWKIEPKTVEVISCMGKTLGRGKFLSQRKEVRHAMEIKKAIDGHIAARFFRLLHEYSLLRHLFPDLEDLWNKNPEQAKLARLSFKESSNLGIKSTTKRMAFLYKIMYNGNVNKAALKMRNFLSTIKWNIAESHFGERTDFVSINDAFQLLKTKSI